MTIFVFSPMSFSTFLSYVFVTSSLTLSPFPVLLLFLFTLLPPFLSPPPLSSSLRRGWSRSHPLGTEWPEWRRLSLPAVSHWNHIPLPLYSLRFLLCPTGTYLLCIESSSMIRLSFHTNSPSTCSLCHFHTSSFKLYLCGLLPRKWMSVWVVTSWKGWVNLFPKNISIVIHITVTHSTIHE